MCGELGVIIELAKENVLRGDSEIKAIDTARKQFEFALNEALEYDFKKSNKKRSKVEKSNEELIKDGDFDTLLQQNMGLVYNVADKYKNDLYYEDIVNECKASMYYAMLEFDIDKGYKFSTFATTCMSRNALKLIRSIKGCVREREWNGEYYKSGVRKYNETYKIMDTLSYDRKMKADGDNEENDFLSKFGDSDDNYVFVDEKEWLESIVKWASTVNFGRSNIPMADIVQMKLNGISNKDICKKYGVNYNTIQRKLIVFGEHYLANRHRFIC